MKVIEQRSLHYLLGNSARNAVIVMREAMMVLSTLQGWHYPSCSPPPTPLSGLVVGAVFLAV